MRLHGLLLIRECLGGARPARLDATGATRGSGAMGNKMAVAGPLPVTTVRSAENSFFGEDGDRGGRAGEPALVAGEGAQAGEQAGEAAVGAAGLVALA